MVIQTEISNIWSVIIVWSNRLLGYTYKLLVVLSSMSCLANGHVESRMAASTNERPSRLPNSRVVGRTTATMEDPNGRVDARTAASTPERSRRRPNRTVASTLERSPELRFKVVLWMNLYSYVFMWNNVYLWKTDKIIRLIYLWQQQIYKWQEARYFSGRSYLS